MATSRAATVGVPSPTGALSALADFDEYSARTLLRGPGGTAVGSHVDMLDREFGESFSDWKDRLAAPVSSGGAGVYLYTSYGVWPTYRNNVPDSEKGTAYGAWIDCTPAGQAPGSFEKRILGERARVPDLLNPYHWEYVFYCSNGRMRFGETGLTGIGAVVEEYFLSILLPWILLITAAFRGVQLDPQVHCDDG